MPEFVFDSGKIFSNFYVAFPRYKFGGFSRLFFDYFGFSLILKGFNVGQEIGVFSIHAIHADYYSSVSRISTRRVRYTGYVFSVLWMI